MAKVSNSSSEFQFNNNNLCESKRNKPLPLPLPLVFKSLRLTKSFASLVPFSARPLHSLIRNLASFSLSLFLSLSLSLSPWFVQYRLMVHGRPVLEGNTVGERACVYGTSNRGRSDGDISTILAQPLAWLELAERNGTLVQRLIFAERKKSKMDSFYFIS